MSARSTLARVAAQERDSSRRPVSRGLRPILLAAAVACLVLIAFDPSRNDAVDSYERLLRAGVTLVSLWGAWQAVRSSHGVWVLGFLPIAALALPFGAWGRVVWTVGLIAAAAFLVVAAFVLRPPPRAPDPDHLPDRFM